MASAPASLHLIDAGKLGCLHDHTHDLWGEAIDGDTFNRRRRCAVEGNGDGGVDLDYWCSVLRLICDVQDEAHVAVFQPAFCCCKRLRVEGDPQEVLHRVGKCQPAVLVPDQANCRLVVRLHQELARRDVNFDLVVLGEKSGVGGGEVQR